MSNPKYISVRESICSYQTIEELQKEIDSVRLRHPSAKDFQFYATYDDGESSLMMDYERLQTPEEIKEEEAYYTRQKEYKRKQYESLKKEFGE